MITIKRKPGMKMLLIFGFVVLFLFPIVLSAADPAHDYAFQQTRCIQVERWIQMPPFSCNEKIITDIGVAVTSSSMNHKALLSMISEVPPEHYTSETVTAARTTVETYISALALVLNEQKIDLTTTPLLVIGDEGEYFRKPGQEVMNSMEYGCYKELQFVRVWLLHRIAAICAMIPETQDTMRASVTRLPGKWTEMIVKQIDRFVEDGSAIDFDLERPARVLQDGTAVSINDDIRSGRLKASR